MFFGHYRIIIKNDQNRGPDIKEDITIEKGNSKINVFKDGTVEIFSETDEELNALKLVVQIAIRSETGLTQFSLLKLKEKDLKTGKDIFRGIFADISTSTSYIHKRDFENNANNLIGLNYKPLQFLMVSTELIDNQRELSILTALTALELELNEIVPIREFSFSQKLKVLKFLKLLPNERYLKISQMWRLRNKLAHGYWRGDQIENAVKDLISKDKEDNQWLTPMKTINKSANSRIMMEVISACSYLSSLRDIIRNKINAY